MNWPCTHTDSGGVRGASATCLAACGSSHSFKWRPCTIHYPHFVSPPKHPVLTDSPCTLGKTPWPQGSTLENTTDRRKCKLLCGSECLCTSPASWEPRDLTTHCRAALYVCRHTHACTNHLTHRLSTHPMHSHEHPWVGIQGPADVGQAGVNGRERLGRKLKAKKVESPAHDPSPITSVNPGAQE